MAGNTLISPSASPAGQTNQLSGLGIDLNLIDFAENTSSTSYLLLEMRKITFFIGENGL